MKMSIHEAIEVKREKCNCHACQIVEEANEELSEHDTAVFAVAEYIKTYALGKCISNSSAADLADEIIEVFTHHEQQPKGPLPAVLLADMIDHEADELADIAKEIDIYNGLKHEGAVKAIGTFKTFLTLFAKQLRTETIEVKKFEESMK